MSARVELTTNTLKRIGLGAKLGSINTNWDKNTTLWNNAIFKWEDLWFLTYNKVPRSDQILTTRITKPIPTLTRVSKPTTPIYTRV
tara:strand:+ start:111 stop:368 length:258 start_codon:yes stop_codon:yes gene_type:complete